MRPVARRVRPGNLTSRQRESSHRTSVIDRTRGDAEFQLPQHSFAEYSANELAYPAVSDFKPDMYFRVDLDIFRGPLDLLLYLVRKHELDVTEIPISLITEQFLDHMQVLEELDVNAVGDFIEVASLLLEIKARNILPQSDDEVEDTLEDPHQELVQRLLEYKRYKDAACLLEERGRQWQQRYSRLPNELPPRTVDPSEQPIHEVELWDLVSAMGRMIRQAERVASASNIKYDETPIQIYMQEIHDRLVANEQVSLKNMFQEGMHKSKIIGIFLALLELIRHHSVCAEQTELHGEIRLVRGEGFDNILDLSVVDDYTHKRPGDEVVTAKPR